MPKISVIVRKAYGAGLYAMAGPAFDPDACIALPSAKIAVMGPQAAINAVFYNQVQAIEDEAERAAYVEKLRREYKEEIDILHLASELVVDAVVQPEDLRVGARAPLRALCRARARVAGQAQRRHAGLRLGPTSRVEPRASSAAEPVGALERLVRGIAAADAADADRRQPARDRGGGAGSAAVNARARRRRRPRRRPRAISPHSRTRSRWQRSGTSGPTRRA